jgi:tetratricopeptide (TPR) repeat protein
MRILGPGRGLFVTSLAVLCLLGPGARPGRAGLPDAPPLAPLAPLATPPIAASGADLATAPPPIALEPYLALQAAAEARRRGDLGGARDALDRASALDPGLVETPLARAWLALRTGEPGAAFDPLLAALATARARFAVQVESVQGAVWGAVAVLVVAFTLLALAHAAPAAAPLHHLLTERLARTIDPRLASPAALVLLALPFVWGAGPLAAALTLLVLAGRARPRGGKALVPAGCALILAVGLARHHGPQTLRPADFGDRAQVLDFADHAPLTPALAARLDAMAAEEIDLALLVHGNALRRAGRLPEAAPLLERYVALRPGDARGYLALGNRSLAAGQPAAAAAGYRRAVALDASSAAAHANLALAYSSLMQFERANAALATATRLDPGAAAAIAAAGARGHGTAPLDAGLEPAELWAIFRAERGGKGVAVPGYLTPWLPWRGGPAWPLALLLLAAAWLLGRPLARNLTPFPCSVCGRVVCRRCVTRRRGLASCRHCQRAIGDIPAEEVVRLLVAVERRRLHGKELFRRLALDIVAPGHGLVLAGRPGAAVALTFAIAAAAVGFMTGGHPVPPLPAVPVGEPGLTGARGFGVLLAALVALNLWLGVRARPRLDTAKRGRFVPLATEPLLLGERGTGEVTLLRTGTDG